MCPQSDSGGSAGREATEAYEESLSREAACLPPSPPSSLSSLLLLSLSLSLEAELPIGTRLITTAQEQTLCLLHLHSSRLSLKGALFDDGADVKNFFNRVAFPFSGLITPRVRKARMIAIKPPRFIQLPKEDMCKSGGKTFIIPQSV